MRLGALLGDEAANELVAALWQSDDAKQQLAGSQLALVLPRLRAPLPYNKFFNSANAGVIEAAIAVVQLHQKDTVEPARVLMVDIFRLLGDDSLLVNDYRRRLSTALY